MRRTLRRRRPPRAYSPGLEEDLHRALYQSMSNKRSSVVSSRSPSPQRLDDDEKQYRLAGPEAPQVVWLEEAAPGQPPENRGLRIIAPGPDDEHWLEALPHMRPYTAYLLPECYTNPDPEQLADLEDEAERGTVLSGVHTERVIISRYTHPDVARAARRYRDEQRCKDAEERDDNDATGSYD